MRRMILSLAAAGSLICQQAAAQLHCMAPADRAAFDVQALRSEMMVLATGCSDDSQYNAFITRYQPELQANERAMDAWFKKKFGTRAQSEHDRFVTDLANAQSSAGTKLGSDFCPHNATIFQEVMALENAGELPPFAAGQNLVPTSLDVCAEETAQAPAPGRRVATKRHKS
jgi:hypothetical protein